MSEVNGRPARAYLQPQINRKKPLCTYAILAVTVIAFVIEYFLGGTRDTLTLVMLGAKFNPFIFMGQYWRLFTPMLLHGDIMHLVMNMVSLYMWGPTVEALYGCTRLLGIYVLSGAAGTAVSYLLSPHISVGASGAIFGLIGALVAFGRSYPAQYKRIFGRQVLSILAINIVYGLLNSGIDNFAHIGGALGGYLAAEMLAPYKNTKITLFRILGVAGFIVLMAVCLLFGPAL